MKQGRFAMLLLFFCFSLLSATAADDGGISMKFNQENLPSALRRLGKVSNYKIMFTYDDVEKYQVNGQVTNVSFKEALEYILKGKPLDYTIDGKLVNITLRNRHANDVTGRITDANGEPEMGAIVQIKGTNEKVITDAEGNFSIATTQGSPTLVVTSIGKVTKEYSVKRRSGNHIILEEDVQMLKDVVVTGYQTISKERATGSFSKVTAADLRNKRYDNLSQLLEGEVAGFNTKSNLVRGTTSMNGVTQPLYVIDGFPVENTRYDDYGSLNESTPEINIEDIESITVLKDAAAASIYGARAANGVVVIVTKKAKEKRTTVSFNTSLTYHPYSFYKKRLTNAADIISLEREWAAQNPNLQGDGAAEYAQSLIDNNAYTSAGIKAIASYYAGNITQSEMESRLNGLASQGYRYYDDVKKYAKRDAFYQSYHLGVGRASDHNNFTASLTYRNNKMNDKYTNDNSWGVDLKDYLDITPWLQMEVGSYTYFKKAKEQTFDPMSPGYSYMPYDGLKNDDGTNYTSTQESRLTASNLAIISNNGLYRLDITPLDEIGRNIRITNYFTSRTYGKLNVTLPYGLKYNVMFQYEYATDKASLLYEQDSYYVRSLVDQYATSDGFTTTFHIPYGNIYYRSNQTSKSYTFRHQLNFDRTFGQKHNVVALFGHEVRKSVLDYDNSTLYNYDPEMLTFSLVDQAVLNSTYGLMGGYGLQSRDFAYIRYIDNRFISLYANAAYTFDDRYTVSGSIRWDRSNLWGTSSKYQKKPIWSLGAGWNIDREEWFDVAWVDRLKFRASYGIAGNVAKDAAPYMTASYYPNYNVGGTYGSIGNRPNPTLRWEKTTTTNIAIDFALLKNRLSGTIEYYNKMGTDLLANTMGVPVEGYGYNTYRINNGEMRNRGVELTLNGQIVRSKDFDLNAVATYSHNKNKVVYVNVEAPFYILQLDYPEAYPIVGNPYNAIYAYQWAGLSSDGLPQVLNADGEAVTSNPSNLDAIVYAGTTEPVDMASLTLSMRYKQFDFSCMWIYQGGHKLRNTDLPMLSSAYNSVLRSYVTTLGAVNKGITNRWIQAGDEAHTDVPRVVFAESALFSDASRTIYGYADTNVISASNLRLANLSLAWNLPRVWLRKAAVSSARVQLNVENAQTWAKSKSAKYLLGGYDAPNYVLGLYLSL